MSAVAPASPFPMFLDPNHQTVHTNATVTTNGSNIYTGFGNKQLTLIVNIKNSPTGTTPTLTYTLQEVDPGDGSTVLDGSVSTAALNAIGTTIISLPATMGGSVKVSWTITGAGASFTGVYATLSAKHPGLSLGRDDNGTERPLRVGTDGSIINNIPDTTSSGALGALNATVAIALAGHAGAGCQLDVGTFIGTVIPELSNDNGTTWKQCFWSSPSSGNNVSSFPFAIANTAQTLPFVLSPGTTHARVRVSVYTSGTMNGHITATMSVGPDTLFDGRPTDTAPPTAAQIGGQDSTGHIQVPAVIATTPAGTELGFVIRNIPSGTQNTADQNLEFGGDNRLRVGQEFILLSDTFEGAAVNTVIWTQSNTGMTQTVATGGVTLNAGSSTTSGNFSILSSVKSIRSFAELGLYFQDRARLITQTNAVLELGWGAVSGTSAPTNGVFFRVPSSGVLQGVINFNGTETVTQLATAGTLAAATYYTFELFVFEDEVRFEVASADGVVNISTTVAIPNGNASATSTSTLSNFARVYNSAATSAAAQIVLGNVIVTQMDSGPQLVETTSVTSVASSATNVTLLAANVNRTGASIFNDSTQNLFVKLGATASATSFTVRLVPNAYYELPLNAKSEPYRGIVDGIWANANGNARVTEEM